MLLIFPKHNLTILPTLNPPPNGMYSGHLNFIENNAFVYYGSRQHIVRTPGLLPAMMVS
jgi:hypothetical protein